MADFFDDYLGALDRAGSFDRRPLPQLPGKPIRFSNQNIGVNKLKTFKKTICEKGLTRHYTNHSGKRTCATQLYNQNVDEQEITRRTGHRSTTAVRKYKRAIDEMSANVSNILDPPEPTQENCPILQEISDSSATPGKRLCTDRQGVNSVLPVDSDSRTVDRDGSKVYNNSVSNPLLEIWTNIPLG